jgi:prephenate dehydrogenase
MSQTDESAFGRVLIVGVGLIGGSWACALRRAGFGGEIVGFETPEAAIAAAPLVDRVESRLPSADDVRDGDLVVLAAPVGAIVELLRDEARSWPAGATVTDVGSTKRAVCDAAVGLAADFVGGHPMAGSERSGAAAARAELFDGATYFLCARPGRPLDRVSSIVGSLGARPVVVTAERHDLAVAFSSHLPQLVALALVDALDGEEVVGGPGLADMTRLSASPWAVWRDILLSNRDHVDTALVRMERGLRRARAALAATDDRTLEELFARANRFDATKRADHE